MRVSFPVSSSSSHTDTEIATMVMLACYESSQHCSGAVTCYCGSGHFTQNAESLSCEEPDPGILQTSGFSTGFANGHVMQCFCGFGYNLNCV